MPLTKSMRNKDKENCIKKKDKENCIKKIVFCPSCGIGDVIKVPISAKYNNKTYQLYACIECSSVFIN